MPRIILTLALAALPGGCATYTERTSPCVCAWEPMSDRQEVAV
jgi:hypothetical protein